MVTHDLRLHFEEQSFTHSNESGSTVIKCVTPTQKIRSIAQGARASLTIKTPSPTLSRSSHASLSPTGNEIEFKQKKVVKSLSEDAYKESKINQPVRLRVNMDDEAVKKLANLKIKFLGRYSK